jgi:glycosyltransferase involved in cell wall biosynthesis
MKFSIVTPSYNQGKYIETTIKSVLNQNHPNYEYIIIDGVSSDNTTEVIAKYHSKIAKYISEPDQGQTDAINKGFTHATGDIYAYLNSDDYYFEDTLEKVNGIFEKHPEVDVVYGDCVFTDLDGNYVRYFSEIWEYYPKKLLNNSNFIMQPSTFWRKEVFEEYGPFDMNLHYGFDWAFWCELTKNNCKFYRVHEVLSANRVYAETKTNSGGGKRLAELRSINSRYKTTLLDNAYYCFSFSEYMRKAEKSFVDYGKQIYYFMLSYQNILFHLRHADEKIINGVYPHSRFLTQHARLKIPFQREYSRITLSLLTPGITGQSVKIYIKDVFNEKYNFENDRLHLKIDATKINGDLDIRMDFEFVYKRPLPFYSWLKSFYQSRKISAELIEFVVK